MEPFRSPGSGNGAGPVDRPRAESIQDSLSRLGSLPTLPEAATRALSVANDRQSSLSDFAAVIERDPPLAAGVLKLANSALFRVRRELVSLDQAVVRLGLRECKNLIIAVGIRSLFRSAKADCLHQCEILWQHSFLTACLARNLNRSLECGYQGEEFACGLAHDLGRILIALADPNYFGQCQPADFAQGPGILAQEQDRLGTDHCTLGAWFGARNQLPAAVVSAIQHHHSLELATSHTNLVALVAMAEHMANYFQETNTAEGYDLRHNPGWSYLDQHFPGGMREKIESLASTLLTESAQEAREADVLSAA